MQSCLKLISPSKKYLDEYKAFYIEDLTLSPNTEKILREPDGILELLEKEKVGKDLPEDSYQGYEYWLVEDNNLIGVIDIRNPLSMFLLDTYGNIGYCIRPSKRGQGYGKKMLSLALPIAREQHHLKKILITANDDNIASWKVIESCGGILARKVFSEEEKVDVRFYWINLDDHIIETDRLILRETNYDDFDNLKSVIGDPINMKFYPEPYNDDGVNRWIKWCMGSYDRRGFGLWAVIIKETGEYIGDCGLSMQNIDGDFVPEIGYHLKLSQHQKGYGYEAASAVRDYIFGRYDFDRLYSYMTAANIASYSLAKKNGMSFIKEYDDEGVPHKVYCITRDEWKRLKNK